MMRSLVRRGTARRRRAERRECAAAPCTIPFATLVAWLFACLCLGVWDQAGAAPGEQPGAAVPVAQGTEPGALRQQALAQPEHPDAWRWHLHAVAAAGEAARRALAADRAAAALADYRQLLAEHLRLWPQAASRAEVAYRLGKLEQHSHAWEAACSALQQVPCDHVRGPAAVQALGECYRQRMLAAAGDAAARQVVVAQAEAFLRTAILGSQGTWPESWDAGRREAANLLAEMWLISTEPRPGPALHYLETALAAPAGEPAWRARACGLAAVAAQMQQGTPANRRWQAELVRLEPRQLLPNLAEFARWATRSDINAETRQAASQIGGAVVQDLREGSSAWPENLRQELARSEARLLVATGRIAEAQAAYAQLVAGSPKPAADLLEAAEVFGARGDRAGWQAALDTWRTIERRSAAGSALWYRAKLQLAATHLELREFEQAQRVLEVTQVLHPDWGGAENLAQCEALRQRLNAARQPGGGAEADRSLDRR